MTKSILIIAAERGLSLGLAGQFFERGWHVTGTARSGADVDDLRRVGADDSSRLSLATIDVADSGQIAPFLASLGDRSFDVIYFTPASTGRCSGGRPEALPGQQGRAEHAGARAVGHQPRPQPHHAVHPSRLGQDRHRHAGRHG